QDLLSAQVLDSELLTFGLGLRLEQVGGGHVDARAGILYQIDTEAGLTDIPGGEKTADICRNTADERCGYAARSQRLNEGRMLGRHGVGFEISVEALAPYGVEPLRVQAGQELRAWRSHHAMWRIEIIAPAEEAAMIGRMPVLASVDSPPSYVEQAIDVRHNLEATQHRKLFRAERREASLGIDDQE